MPSQVLHILFGEDVITEIHRRLAPRFGVVAGKALEKIQNTYQKTFALGCQGPDLFYHSRSRRPVGLEYGTLLHRRGAGDFTAELLKMGLEDPPPEKGINALGAYALGFMTHAILDRKAHPYIIYKSCWLAPTEPRTLSFAQSHAFFERIIDVLMLKHLRGADISSWDQESILAETCKNPPLGLKELLARALVLTFPERAGKDEKLSARIDNAFQDSAVFYHLTAPAFTQAYAQSEWKDVPFEINHLIYVYPDELPKDIDFLNLEKRLWRYPAGEEKEDDRSFPEVYNAAVESAADSLSGVLGLYLETGLFPIAEAAQVIGNGGLSIVNEDGIPCRPSCTDPLPLDMNLIRRCYTAKR